MTEILPRIKKLTTSDNVRRRLFLSSSNTNSMTRTLSLK